MSTNGNEKLCTEKYALRMRPAVYKAGEQAAADDNRSLAFLMEMLLIAHLREKGYLPNATGFVRLRGGKGKR